MPDNWARKKRNPHDNAALQQEGANLVDDTLAKLLAELGFSADRPFLARSSKPPRPPQFARMIRMKFAGGAAPSFYLQLVEPYPRRAISDLSIIGCTGVNAPIRRSPGASRKRAVAPFAYKAGQNACIRRKNFLKFLGFA